MLLAMNERKADLNEEDINSLGLAVGRYRLTPGYFELSASLSEAKNVNNSDNGWERFKSASLP